MELFIVFEAVWKPEHRNSKIERNESSQFQSFRKYLQWVLRLNFFKLSDLRTKDSTLKFHQQKQKHMWPRPKEEFKQCACQYNFLLLLSLSYQYSCIQQVGGIISHLHIIYHIKKQK